MTDDTSSNDTSILIRLSDGEWTVTDVEGVTAEVSNVLADGHGNGKLSVMYQPE